MPAPDRRRRRRLQARRGQAAHRARRARRLRARPDRADARGGRSAAGRGDPEGEPAADRPALQDRQERGAAPGQRGRGARLPAGRDAGGVERQGRQPLRPRSGAGLGPRRLRRSTRCCRRATRAARCWRRRASRASWSWSASTTPATRATAR